MELAWPILFFVLLAVAAIFFLLAMAAIPIGFLFLWRRQYSPPAAAAPNGAMSPALPGMSDGSPAGADVYTQWGGYYVGFNHILASSRPFARLEVRPGEIALRCLTRRLVFPGAVITRLSIYNGIGCRGLRIEHRATGYMPFVLFCSYNLPELQQRLSQAGFAIEGIAREHQPSELPTIELDRRTGVK